MKFTKQWQLSLGAILLVTLIACHNKRGEVQELSMKLSEATPGGAAADYKAVSANLADSTAVATVATVADEFKNEERKQLPQQVPGNKQPTRQQAPDPAPNTDWDKKIIRNANLSVEVKDYAHYNDGMRDAVKKSGGYIANEEQSQSDYKLENVVTIKVPVAQFEEAVKALTSGTDKLIVKRITSEDVTGEVVDTRSRLEAKRQVRLRYLDLLKQAKNMEEILQVQNEINDIQENMESAAGRINYLNHAAAFSTIQLSFYQVLNPGAKEAEEKKPGFGSKLLNAFTEGFGWLGDVAILLASLWPLWIGLFIAWRVIRKYRHDKTVVVAPTVAEKQEA